MLSSTGMSPYGLMKTFEGINNGVDNVMNNNVPSNRTSGKNEHGGITAQNFGGAKKNAITMQDKTGSYGQKRKPGDYLR